jgi:hypothetical protein
MEKQIRLNHPASTYVSSVLLAETDSDDPRQKTTLRCFADGLPGIMLCQSEDVVQGNQKRSSQAYSVRTNGQADHDHNYGVNAGSLDSISIHIFSKTFLRFVRAS